MKRRLSLILCLAIALSITGCQNESNPGNETTPSQNNDVTTAPENTYTPDDREYWEPIKAENLGGDFTVGVYQEHNFDVEEENGDTINDAIYARNLAVEQLYGVEISETITDRGKFQSMVLAADDSIDVCMASLTREAANFSTADLLIDLGTIDSMNLDAEWWDQNLLSEVAPAGKRFFCAGDIDYILYSRAVILTFNKQKLADIYDEDIYQLVKDGKWTFDVFDKLQRNSTQDLNGDGKMDDKDSYGIINSSIHATMLYYASGERILTPNKSGGYDITMNSVRGNNVISRLFEITLGSEEYCYNTDKVNQDGIWERVRAMFRNEQALFQSTVLYNIINQRSMESDFGVLPYPKYDEAQSGYYSATANANKVFVVPKSVSDTDRIGKIMNALCFEGRFTVKKAFYDEALGVKFIRDDESKDMLDIIFDSVIFDVGYIFNPGGLGTLIQNMHKSGNPNFASQYAGLESAAKTATDELVENMKNLG